MSKWTERDVKALPRLAEQVRQREYELRVQVEYLRREGCPWSVIGESLGITRQAAQQRFRTL